MNEILSMKENSLVTKQLGQCVITKGWEKLPFFLKGYDSVYVLCDEAVEPVVNSRLNVWKPKWRSEFSQHLPPVDGLHGEDSRHVERCYVLKSSESIKTIETACVISDWLLRSGADRKSLLLAVGGGITTDIAGFVASIYMRGMPVAYIPTTLLAQVDAAIGGKNGVNQHCYKNILGTIRQPDFTYINVEVLETLPHRELMCGASEMLKTFLIADKDAYCEAVGLFKKINAEKQLTDFTMNELLPFIQAAVTIKRSIVAKDQYDTGERHKLNLGHTFAHAIEHLAQLSDLDIRHGEAVAMGIILSAKLAQVAGLSNDKIAIGGTVNLNIAGRNLEVISTSDDNELVIRLKEDFRNCGLPVDCPFKIRQLVPVIAKDKKKQGSTVKMVFLRDIANVVILPFVTDQALMDSV